jgi:hypothetical protein
MKGTGTSIEKVAEIIGYLFSTIFATWKENTECHSRGGDRLVL